MLLNDGKRKKGVYCHYKNPGQQKWWLFFIAVDKWQNRLEDFFTSCNICLPMAMVYYFLPIIYFTYKTNRSEMKKSYILIALMALLGLVIWSYLQYDFSRDGNVQYERTAEVKGVSEINRYATDSITDKLMAYNLATDFVLKSLQEPTTAEFPNTKEKLKHVKYLGENRYRINSWVDSQDTYGAMTRRSFSCIIKTDSSGVIKESFVIEELGYIPYNK